MPTTLVKLRPCRKAAAAQQKTLNWIQQVYGNTQSNLQPYIGTGTSALSALSGFYGLPGGSTSGATQAYQQFTNTPTYQFPLQQANLGANRALAASGLTGSPGAIGRTVGQLDAGYASQGLGQYLSGLTGLAGSGQNAASSLGSIGVDTGAQIGAANTAIGSAQAAGTIGSTIAINQGIGGALGPIIGNSGNSSYSSGGLIGQLSSLFGGGNATGSIPAGGTGMVPGGEGGGQLYGNST
jgi:hypothetical protein